MSENGKKRSRKSTLVPQTLNKLNKAEKVKKRKPSEDATSEESRVKQENYKIITIYKNATPYHDEVAIWEYPEELKTQNEVRMKTHKMTVKKRSVCSRIEPMTEQMENENSVMPFPVRKDSDLSVNKTVTIESFVSSEKDLYGDAAHTNEIIEKQGNLPATNDTVEVNDKIIDVTENNSNGEVSPEEIYLEEIYRDENFPEEIFPEEIYLDETYLEETSLAEISSEEISPEEISSEEISPEEISSEEISPEEISSEEISPEDISPGEINPKERSLEEIDPEKILVKVSSAEIFIKKIAPEKIFPELSLSHWDIVKFFKDYTDLQMFRLMLEIKSEKVLYTKIVSYKCYECECAWQHYAEFRDHMKFHSGKLNLGLEYVAPVNKHIIAYKYEFSLSERRSHLFPVLENGLEIFKCLLCNRVLKSKTALCQHKFRNYLCVCGKIGYCDIMGEHKRICLDNKLHSYPKKCRGVLINWNMIQTHAESCKGERCISCRCLVCQFYASSAKTLFLHQRDEHTVRSDEITTVSLRKCGKCGQIHPEPSQAHYCPRKADAHPCIFCGDRFQSALFLEVHLNASGYRPKCSVDNCDAILEAGCLQPIHAIEDHDALNLAANGRTATGHNHFRSNHTRHGRFRNQLQLKGVTLNGLLDKSTFVEDQRDLVLRAVRRRRLAPDLTPPPHVHTPPALDYDCPLLDNLTLSRAGGRRERAGPMTSPAEGGLLTGEGELQARGDIEVKNVDVDDASPTVISYEIVPKDSVDVEEGEIHLIVTKETVPHVNSRSNCNVDDVTSEQTNIGIKPKVSYPTSGSRDTVVTETDTLDASQDIQVSESDSIEETSSTDSETEFQDNTDIVVEEFVANKTLNVEEKWNIDSETEINENAGTVYEVPTTDVKTEIQDNVDKVHDVNIPEDYCASYNKIQESLTECEESNVSTKLTITEETIDTPEVTEAELKQIKSNKWLNQLNNQSTDAKKMTEAKIKVTKINEITKAAKKSFKAKEIIEAVINTASKENNIKIFRLSEQKQQDVISTETKKEPKSYEEELLLFQEFVNEDKGISSVPSTGQEPMSVEEFIKNNSEISLDLDRSIDLEYY